jgi:hypothetical protein
MTQAEQPEKYNWWLNELESLGINRQEINGISNHKAENLTEAVEQTLYEEYHRAYNMSDKFIENM